MKSINIFSGPSPILVYHLNHRFLWLIDFLFFKINNLSKYNRLNIFIFVIFFLVIINDLFIYINNY
jgi:hypothetical protein